MVALKLTMNHFFNKLLVFSKIWTAYLSSTPAGSPWTISLILD